MRQLREGDPDVALSWRMKADYGITIPLKLVADFPTSLNVLPIFVKRAAPLCAAMDAPGGPVPGSITTGWSPSGPPGWL